MDGPTLDRLYQMVTEAHRDLSPDASRRLDARLVLLLAAHIGDPEVVAGILRQAKKTGPAGH